MHLSSSCQLSFKMGDCILKNEMWPWYASGLSKSISVLIVCMLFLVCIVIQSAGTEEIYFKIDLIFQK